MKTKDIANSYGISQVLFEEWLRETAGISYKSSMMGAMSIDDDSQVDEAVSQFQQYREERAELAASERAAMEHAAQQKEVGEKQKQKALATMLITSGFNFDGYKITKYSGYISGDDVIQIDRGSQGFFSSVTDVGSSLMSSLANIRRKALTELKEAAYDLGCNAVIGVDFDYLTLDPETAGSGGGTLYLPYVFGVTANGNAVIIEKS